MIVFIVITAVLVVALALVAVGRVTWRLEAQAPPSVYAVDEAVEFVADRLPDDVTAQLSFDDVREILQWHIEYLADRGVAVGKGDDRLVAGPLVAAEDDALAYVLGKAAEADIEVDDVWVVQVLDANEEYLEAIGAIGPVIAPVDDTGRRHRSRPAAVAVRSRKPPPRDRPALAHWADQGKEVVHKMNDGCCGTLEVAGR